MACMEAKFYSQICAIYMHQLGSNYYCPVQAQMYVYISGF